MHCRRPHGPRPRGRWGVFVAAAFTLLPRPLNAALIDPRERAATAFVESLQAATGAPAVSVAVAQRGEIVWERGFGHRIPETRVVATNDTQYRIGALTQLFTVALLAEMVESGEIGLDVDVRELVPAVAHYPAPVTPRMLAGHLAGIRQFADATEALNRDRFDSTRTALGRFVRDPLAAPPGTTYLYSAYGYVLLARALEAAGGKPYLDLLRARVLQPLQLGSVVFDTGPLAGGRRAMGFDRVGTQVVRSPLIDLSDRQAAAGLLASAHDLARFGAAHLNDRLVGTALRRTLFQPQETVDGATVPIGLGWRVGVDPEGRSIAYLEGTIPGGRAVLWLDPAADLVVALVANLGGAGFGEADARMLAGLFRSMESGAVRPRDLEGSYLFERTAPEKEPVTGRLELTRVRDDEVEGELVIGEVHVDLVWGRVWGGRLLLAAADPSHQLELLWLRPEGERLIGHTWRPDDRIVAWPAPEETERPDEPEESEGTAEGERSEAPPADGGGIP